MTSPSHRTSENAANCPTIEFLRDFVQNAGSLPSEVALHLEHCSSCQETVDRLQEEAKLAQVNDLRGKRSSVGNSLLFLKHIEAPSHDSQTAVQETPVIPGMDIESILGQGGMGIVYLAKQSALSRHVALKTIRVGHGANPEFLTRFGREARALAALTHENIVRAYEFGEQNGSPYLVMEYVPGRTLSRQLTEQELSSHEAAELLIVLACAVDYAHSKGVVHRDLKPGNVLITPDGTPKITDFGLARLRDADALQETLGGRVGTPCYMAPEQAAGSSGVGPAADVYALGGILYEVLCHRPPFTGTDIADVLQQVQTSEPLPPRVLCPRMPRDLETICLKCLNKSPSDRYPSALALAEDLQAFLESRPIVARPIGVVGRSLRFARRRKLLVAFVSVLMLAFVGINVATMIALAATAKADKAVISENTQKQRADDAEGESLTRLSDSMFNSGNFYAATGDWNLAIRDYDAALQHQTAQSGRIHLALAFVYSQLSNQVLSRTHVEAAEASLGADDAGVLLAKAGLSLSGDRQQSRDLAQAAIDKGGLSDGDRYFATALCAKTMDAAIESLNLAVAAQPNHLQSRRILCGLLTLRRDFAGAAEHARALTTYFPKDQMSAVLQALQFALNGDATEARNTLNQATSQLDEPTAANLREIYAFLASTPKIEVDTQGIPTMSTFDGVKYVLRGLALAISNGEAGEGLITPDVEQAIGKLTNGSVNPRIWFNSSLQTKLLREVSDEYRDGYLLFLLGQSHLKSNDVTEAIKAFRDATNAPSFIDVRLPAHFLALRCAFQIRFDKNLNEETQKELRETIGTSVRAVLDAGEDRPSHLYVCGQVTWQTGQNELLRLTAERWREIEPASSGPDLYMAYHAFQLKQFLIAIHYARLVLQNTAGAPKEFRDDGIDLLGQARVVIENSLAKLAEVNVELNLPENQTRFASAATPVCRHFGCFVWASLWHAVDRFF